MTGIEKITGRIQADSEAEVQVILAEAQSQADAVTARYQAQADQVCQELVNRGKVNAADREERLGSAAGMQARQLTLKTRQEMLDAAFDLALDKLNALSGAEQVELLAKLAASASSTGHEQVQLGTEDNDRIGAKVVSAANALLGSKGQLTLSPKAGAFQGGLVLSDGEVEVNCTYGTLVRLARSQMAGDVAKVLFG